MPDKFAAIYSSPLNRIDWITESPAVNPWSLLGNGNADSCKPKVNQSTPNLSYTGSNIDLLLMAGESMRNSYFIFSTSLSRDGILIWGESFNRFLKIGSASSSLSVKVKRIE